MRRIYNRPWQHDCPANPGKVSTCIQVGMRPETTLIALESIPDPAAKLMAAGAELAAVSGIDTDNVNSDRSRLVFNEALQLSKSPSMEPCAHAPARADVITNVREILQHESGGSEFHSRGDDGLARLVINMPYAPPLPAGDLPELLFGALAAVGLKTTTQGKVTIAPVAQSLAAEDLAGANGGERIFSYIHTYNRTSCQRRRIVRFYNQVEEPHSLAENQLGFLRCAGRENATLMLPEPHCDRHAAVEGIKRNSVLDKPVGSLVEMNTRLVESDCPNRFTPLDPSQRALSLVRLANRKNRITSHLAPEICLRAQARVSEPVQVNTIPTPMPCHKWHQPIARIGIDRSQRAQGSLLLRRGNQCNRSRAKHVSMPVSHRLRNIAGTLRNVATYIPFHSLNPRPQAGHSITVYCTCIQVKRQHA